MFHSIRPQQTARPRSRRRVMGVVLACAAFASAFGVSQTSAMAATPSATRIASVTPSVNQEILWGLYYTIDDCQSTGKSVLKSNSRYISYRCPVDHQNSMYILYITERIG